MKEPAAVLILLAVHVVSVVGAANESLCSVNLALPKIILSGVTFEFSVQLPPYINSTTSLPDYIDITLLSSNNITLYRNNISISTRNSDGLADLNIGHIKTNRSVLDLGYRDIILDITDADTGDSICSTVTKGIWSVPGWLTIFPPIVAAVVAIVFRQVLIALLMGIWMAAILAYGYNPFTAILRTLDTYFVQSMADEGHAAIIVGTFFLAGLIGMVQRSGGALGLAKFFGRFASSPRKGCFVLLGLSLLIFFDDYTCILVVGNSLRIVMDAAGVSKDKFSFILQSLAPSLPSFIPVSSWIGAQIGYVDSGFNSCNDNQQPFNIILQTLPYRFLQVLMIYCVFLVCVLNRDFACMWTSERQNFAKKQLESRIKNDDTADEEEDGETMPLIRSSNNISTEEDLTAMFEGPLAPKSGVPHRWFNALVPFLIVIVVTFVGMVLDGWWVIRSNNEDSSKDYISMTASNIFSNADAIAALIWSSCLATVVLMAMLMVQRIMYLRESMEAWVEGIKDVIEPLIILMLAWALGTAITDIQTSNYIAKILTGKLSPTYLPVLTTIIGYFISYATGSAFGTMGILFPLVIPIVCQLAPDDKNLHIQTAAAILSSCIFGNLLSPLADLTILTRVATQCDLTSHLKSCSPYVLLVGFITIVFGALPVGVGWYPVWAAWIIMVAVLTAVFVVLGAGPSPSSRSLCKIGCPCLFVALQKVQFSLAWRYNSFKVRHGAKLQQLCFWRRMGNKSNIQRNSPIIEDDYETAVPLKNDESEHSDRSSYQSF